MRKSRLTMLIAVSLLLVAGLGYYFFVRPPQRIKTTVQPVAVKTVKVKQLVLPQTISAIGTLSARDRVQISPEIPGQVVAINFEAGDAVKKGQALFQLDDAVYQAKLIEAKASYKTAQVHYQRVKQLSQTGLTSKDDVDTSYAAYKTAQSHLAFASEQLNDTVLRAPIAGRVGERTVSIGQYVAVGQALLTLVDTQHLLVNYTLPAKYAARVKEGQRVFITLDDHAKSYTATVSYVAAEIDQTTGTLSLQARILVPKQAIRPGQTVQINHQIGAAVPQVAIPQSAIVSTVSGPVVYQVIDNKVISTPVTLGDTVKDKILVTKGLALGDEVVVRGTQHVHDGSLVKIAN